ncbi:hypothetical protein [Novosphingobium sp. P6W]|jgi:flagellar basal body-associated protein FliL|uniref:hypothetical protein n=1 Tax=Novosphingobium sp. P6W TaxID=1609758 RepID=UPI0005C31802|nr:hypothetical protein [Novosphingobium sp. P6W]AXB75353.1 hypothetical protein TQ38_001560 [Novosphingobium sp. P6W]KIS32604.1 hypothetical protein TQ38_09845 [Novosphingobium sp. P6W]
MSSCVPYRRVAAVLLLAAAVPVHGANTEPRKAAEVPPADASFVTMQSIDAPIVDAGRVDGVLHVTITVQAKSEDEAAALTKRMPELRAAALPATIEFARLRASRFAPVDVERLAATITLPVKRVDATVDKVLIVKVSATEA